VEELNIMIDWYTWKKTLKTKPRKTIIPEILPT